MSASPPTPAVVRFPVVPLATALAFVLLAVRQHAFTVRYAVDVMYWDTWELYDPLFNGQGWWATFDQQHGPHRQGLGGLLMRAMATRSRWDTRNDALSVSWTLIAAAALGVHLARRCGVRGWPLLAVPAIYLNIHQYQMFVASANPAPGALPILLLTAFALAWFQPRPGRRLTWVAGLTACAVFTGFGLFVGVVAPVLLLLELRAAAGDRRRLAMTLAALVATLATWAAFAVGYNYDEATAGGHHFAHRWPDFLRFVAIMLANAVGWTGVGPDAVAVGTVLVVTVAAVCLIRGRRVVAVGASADPVNTAIFSLALFGLMYLANTALGRSGGGLRLAAASRYVTLCIPAGLAILLHVATASERRVRRLAVACGGLLVAGTIVLPAPNLAEAEWAHDGCLRWREAYLSTLDQTAADRLADFPIYAEPTLARRLAYLRQHRLNLFDPAAFDDAPNAPATRPVRRR